MCLEIEFEALSTSFIPDDGQGKEGQPCTNSTRNQKGSSMHKPQTIKTPVKRPIISHISAEKRLNPQNLQVWAILTNFHLIFFWLGEGEGMIFTYLFICIQWNEYEFSNVQLERRVKEQASLEAETLDERLRLSGDDSPNRISENIVKCLSSILLRLGSTKNQSGAENLPSFSTLAARESSEETNYRDPYGICSEFGKRDIGPYKKLCQIEAGSINLNRTANSMFLLSRLK